MGKNKYRKNQNDQQQDFNKKKKNIITQQLLMDKSNMDFTQFIPLLPEDVLYPPYKISMNSTKAILKILTDLNYLLYLQPKNFWATVSYNISFGRCLSSCLSQLSCRWMNSYRFLGQEETQQQIVEFEFRMVKDHDYYTYLQALQQVLIKIIFRIMSFQQQDPKLNEIYNFGENIITKMNIFSLPKLLQLIQIYGQQEQNQQIIKIISKNYLRTINNVYKYFIDQLLPHMIKKIQQNNRDVKTLTDRQEFGINYSYKRVSAKIASPGQEELKRKVVLLMNYISFLKMIKNTKFLTEEIYDHMYFNYQVNFVLENAFYEIDAAYKIWNYQTMERKLLPLMNHVLVEIIEYFIEYFNRVNERLVRRNIKTSIQAYIRSLQRFFVDYGKRHSLGKKGSNIRNMTLYKLLSKRFNLIEMMEELYKDQQQNKTYEFNMQYLIDFKIALQESNKEANQFICANEPRQQIIQQQTQVPDDLNMDDVDQPKNDLQNPRINNQQVEQKDSQEQQNQLKYFQPETQDKLQFLVSKKSREDDYYQQLYMKQRQRFKIQYDDEYDDLVDYDKRPLFLDSASSDSDSEEQLKIKRLVSNETNQKINQEKHIKFQQKQKDKKKQAKYTKVSKQEKNYVTQKNDNYNDNSKSQAQNFSQKQEKNQDSKKKYIAKQKNNLQNLLQQQRMPREGQQYQLDQQQNSNNQRGGQGGRGGPAHKRRYVPQNNHGDKKDYNQKGRNSNKNRQHGNPQNQGFGGGKKYREKY